MPSTSTSTQQELQDQFLSMVRKGQEIALDVIKSMVDSVQTMQMKGKTQVRGRIIGKRNDWKKAIVTLKPDHKIELFEQI